LVFEEVFGWGVKLLSDKKADRIKHQLSNTTSSAYTKRTTNKTMEKLLQTKNTNNYASTLTGQHTQKNL